MFKEEKSYIACLTIESEKSLSNPITHQEKSLFPDLLNGWEQNTTLNILNVKQRLTHKPIEPSSRSQTPNLLKKFRFAEKKLFRIQKKDRKSGTGLLTAKVSANDSLGALAFCINGIRKQEIIKGCEKAPQQRNWSMEESLKRNIIIQSILPDRMRGRKGLHSRNEFLKDQKVRRGCFGFTVWGNDGV